MLPAPGQGALAIECRDGDRAGGLLQAVTDEATAAAVTAERSLLAALEAGCSAPIGAYAAGTDAVADAGGRHEPGRKPGAARARRPPAAAGARQLGRDLAAELLRPGLQI